MQVNDFSEIMNYLMSIIVDVDLRIDNKLRSNKSLFLNMNKCCGKIISGIPNELLVGDDIYSKLLQKLKECQNGIPKFIKAFENVDRALFIPYLPLEFYKKIKKIDNKNLDELVKKGRIQINSQKMIRDNPYLNIPIHIGHGATCSAPHVIILYNAIADLFSKAKIFEAGTGCGYHAAVTASINPEFRIYSAEIIPELCSLAAGNISNLPEGKKLLERIIIEEADCIEPECSFMMRNAPYDFIYFTFMLASQEIVRNALGLLNKNGILLAPLNISEERSDAGKLVAIHKKGNEMLRYNLADVLFTPAIKRC